MAPPIKLTPEVQDKIVRHLRIGSSVKTTARCAGISRDTFYDWMKTGARGRIQPFVAFADAVRQALVESESRESRSPARRRCHDRVKVGAQLEVLSEQFVELARLIRGEPDKPRQKARQVPPRASETRSAGAEFSYQGKDREPHARS
jgi:hypothetical protein